jgi:predicted RNase H-like nuclease
MKNHDSVIGIDGCKYGWVSFQITTKSAIKISLHNSINSLFPKLNNIERIFIDVPIGLARNSARICDIEAKNILGKKGASLFQIPVREAVYADNYKSGCEINYEICGKKFSKQAWNILPKVIEVDQFLKKNKLFVSRLYESHPELCFYHLNNNLSIFENKKTTEGQLKRITLIKNYLPGFEKELEKFLEITKRKDVAADDVIDAAVLAIAASNFNRLRRVPKEPVYDKFNLPMNIYY